MKRMRGQRGLIQNLTRRRRGPRECWILTGRHGHERLYGPPGHHADHHDGEDGDGVAGHVHDEQVHGDLLQGPESHVPAALCDKETSGPH